MFWLLLIVHRRSIIISRPKPKQRYKNNVIIGGNVPKGYNLWSYMLGKWVFLIEHWERNYAPPHLISVFRWLSRSWINLASRHSTFPKTYSVLKRRCARSHREGYECHLWHACRKCVTTDLGPRSGKIRPWLRSYDIVVMPSPKSVPRNCGICEASVPPSPNVSTYIENV